MDSTSLPDFDFSGELWRFVRARFSYQAKALKGIVHKPLSQCFELIAIAHGFRSWRGLSSTLDALCSIDRLEYTSDWDMAFSGSLTHHMAARYSLAIRDSIDELVSDDLPVDWVRLEQVLRHPPKLIGFDDFDVIDGMLSSYPLRESLFFKAAWVGRSAFWSEALLDTVWDVSARLEELLGEDEGLAGQAISAMYGAHPQDRIDFWEFSPAMQLTYDIEVGNLLDHGQAISGFLEDSAKAYRMASDSAFIDVQTWREASAVVHYGSLDNCIEASFVTSLIRVNAPSDAFVQVSLTSFTDYTPTHQFVAGAKAFAPSAQKAAQLGACMAGIARFSKMNLEEVRSQGLPNERADWYLVYSE